MQVFGCPFNSFSAVFCYVRIVINEVVVVMDFAAVRRLQIRGSGPFFPVGRGSAAARALAKLADRLLAFRPSSVRDDRLIQRNGFVVAALTAEQLGDMLVDQPISR